MLRFYETKYSEYSLYFDMIGLEIIVFPLSTLTLVICRILGFSLSSDKQNHPILIIWTINHYLITLQPKLFYKLEFNEFKLTLIIDYDYYYF